MRKRDIAVSEISNGTHDWGTRFDRLIWLFGASRSGTNVFQLMLDLHKEISSGWDVNFIFDHLRKYPGSDKWTYDLESLRLDRIFQLYKLDIFDSEDAKEILLHFLNQIRRRTQGILVVTIHRNLDKLSSFFPDAKIIHIIRDPRDVAKSCINMGWAGNSYYAVGEWLNVENSWEAYESTFNTENVMEIFFKSLISDTKTQLEAVCRFIGVPFSPDMLDYPSRSTYQAPDPSKIDQWKEKLTPREIALVEIRTKRLLLDRHYELSGYPLNPPSLAERIHLAWANKINKWKFGCNRYGYFIYVMEKITRKFAKTFHPNFMQRINEIENQHLQ